MANLDPVVTRLGALDAQVCVPEDWTDEQIIQFFKQAESCCTEPAIRKEGDRMLGGAPERNPCDTRAGFVHVVLDY